MAASVVDGRRSVTGKLKETAQRLLTALTHACHSINHSMTYLQWPK